ncbi:MAG: cation-binding protein [Promethearchaeota archaeon]|nr:MAG: cation-binding protein [Candidatus Lokiarchaeota archaeon]
MLPIGPLMIEHRLIERMIDILKDELQKIEDLNQIDPIFIDNVVDFIRTYADQTHHGKEEDILFRELEKKEISSEHKTIMDELINEHIFGRKTTGELVQAKEKFLQGEEEALSQVINKIKSLIEFYPKHIEKEDKHFFIPVMNYFTKEEQDAMLIEGQIFDRKMIHRKYNTLVAHFEKSRNLLKKESNAKWLDFI